jgi:threonine/homoserine/homoserine lactone efflux protein
MDTNLVIQGVIVGLILAVPVGPLSLICIQRTLSGGKLHGLFSGLGVTVADSVYALVAFLGLSVISGVIIGQEMALRIFAGLVLITVGMRIIFFVPASRQENTEDGSYLKDFLSMAALTIANPMTLIFLMVTLPGYGFIFGGTSLTAAAAFVAGFFFGSAMWWVILCGSIGSFRTRISESNVTRINRVSGLFIICVGAVMIISPVLVLAGITVS